MNHYMEFDPYLIRERNEQMRREVYSLRLRERLHERIASLRPEVWVWPVRMARSKKSMSQMTRTAEKHPITETPTTSRSTCGLRAFTVLLAAVLAAGALMLAWGAEPAEAAFPRSNGLIAFVSDRTTGADVNNPTGDLEIFTMDPNDPGNTLTQLTDNTSNDYQPAWSPDGQKIAFRSNRDGISEIYVMDANGQNQVRLTSNAAYDVQPTFSPDGTKIAFASSRVSNGSNWDVYTMSSSDGSHQVRFTKKSAADDGAPAWSPDGQKIAFVSNRSGNYEVYVMKARPEGKKNRPRNRSENPADEFAPSWSPDGTQIAFSSNRDGNSEIYTMNEDGTGQIRLTNNTADNVSPAWSPDGQKIAFSSNRDGDSEIYVMNLDGSNQVNITNNAAVDAQPDWQPA